MQSTKVSWRSTVRGFNFEIFKTTNKYKVIYPDKTWNSFPINAKKVLIQNFLYARTRPLILTADHLLEYQTPKPFFKKMVDWGIKKDLSSIELYNNLPASSLRKKFKANFKTVFLSPENKEIKTLPIGKKPNPEKVLLALSFGKDSLLSYALLKDLGIDYDLCFCREMENFQKNDNQLKNSLLNSFCRKFNEKIIVYYDNVDEIFNNSKAGNLLDEIDNTNVMMAYALELLPIANLQNCGLLAFGNERDFDHTFIKRGLKIYSSFDQSSYYNRILNKNLKKFTKDQMQVISLVEPLYNLAEMKIILSRYQYLLPYITSCHLEEKGKGRWCHDCRVCCEMYLYVAAWNHQPEKLGIKVNMFQTKFKEYYAILAENITNPSLMPRVIRDQQLLAFLMAYRNGFTGPLIDLFKKKHLAEAVKRKKALRKQFLSVGPMVNLPPFIAKPLKRLLEKELSV